MSFARFIATVRMHYHANLVDLGNALNQLHILNDEVAEEFCKKHAIKALEAGARRWGKNLDKIFKDLGL